MRAHSRRERVEALGFAQQPVATSGVGLHHRKLLRGDTPGLLQDLVGESRAFPRRGAGRPDRFTHLRRWQPNADGEVDREAGATNDVIAREPILELKLGDEVTDDR